MAVSAAKLEANRRNAQKSTGPRTDEGKRVSSLNAVTHGLRAETLVLLDEDPQALAERRDAWRACLLPDDDVEERLVDSAVVHTWMEDRARRAQVSRINVSMLDDGVEQALTNEKEVDDLGRRLFKDRFGPLVFYPTVSGIGRDTFSRTSSTSYVEKGGDDPNQPSTLVLCLQSTLLGCEWMLGEWAKLKAVLDEGQAWLSADKLKAIRLLGKQPFDAIDEREVAMVFLASYVLKGDKGSWYWEISIELNEKDVKSFQKSAAVRELESLMPKDAAQAREALLGLIERATERLKLKAEGHRERARAKAALAADCLAFDDSPQGERLRRFELASGRGLSRSLEDLRKHRRSPLSVVSSSSSIVSGPLSGSLSDAGCGAEGISEATAINEPTVAGENVTNESLGGPLSVVRCPLPDVGDTFLSKDEPIATNEPTEVQEITTNEPTVFEENATNEPIVFEKNATNEPTDVGENVTNEPTEVHEHATNEPKLADESFEQGVARRRALREATTRELNEEARREAEAAMAMRRARVREQKQKNAKPRNQPKGRQTRAGQDAEKETAARQMKELNELVATLLGPLKKARRAST